MAPPLADGLARYSAAFPQAAGGGDYAEVSAGHHQGHRRPERVKDLRPKPARVTLATVRRLALSFPGVEEGLSYGTPGFRVRGKFLARIWEDGDVLVVKCGDQERDCRLQAVLEEAWRRQAPRRMVAEYDRLHP